MGLIAVAARPWEATPSGSYFTVARAKLGDSTGYQTYIDPHNRNVVVLNDRVDAEALAAAPNAWS